jgi:hypothetical protein
MRLAILLTFLSLPLHQCFAQSSFEEYSDVVTYMDSKSFSNSEMGLEISFEYISEYNTYGIVVLNKFDVKFYYINVNVNLYGSFADLYGMNPEDGSNFGFRLFKEKLIVGYGEEREVTFYKN